MRKLFLLIPALVLSLFANAAVININTGTADALRKALNTAADGDIIEMAAGTYVESNENFIAFTSKHVTVRAAEGAEVIIQPQVPITVSEGGCAHFQNVKIDASRIHESATWYEHIIYATDAAANNRIVFEGCEIYGFALNKSLISCPSANTLDELSINNCYFHNIHKSCVFIENTSNAIAISITNSTFANITTDAGSYYAGVIDSRATSGSFLVDHCTFYNVEAMSTGYAAIGQVKLTSGATVSNCIFALSTSGASSNRTIRDVVAANNCLVYNYTTDNGYGMQSNVTKTGCFTADPLFTDAANGDFSLAGNWVTMELSPARGAATDGSDLGDPRWASDEILPEVDFATPYQLTGDKAQIAGNLWYNSEDAYLYYNNKSENGTAKWKIHAERACVVGVELNMHEGSPSVHKIRIEVQDAEGNSVGEFAEQASTLPGTLVIPAEGDYTIILHDDQAWTSAQIDNITLSYIGGATQAMPGTTNIDDAWFSSNGTRAAGEYISIPAGHQDEGWVKWNVSFANTGNFNVTVNIDNANGHNYTVALYRSESDASPITISEGEQKSTLSTLELGTMEVPAGNYILKVTNAVKWSDAKLISVKFAYAGGGLVDIPNAAIPFADAILSTRAYVDGGNLYFTDYEHRGTISGEYAEWNVNATEGIYQFTANCNSTEGYSHLKITIADSEDNIVYSKQTTSSYSGEKEVVFSGIYLSAGNYTVQLENPANWSHGYISAFSATAEENVFILNENTDDDGSIAAAAGNTYKFLLKRSFTAGRYYTICLPVGSWDSELKLAFGADYELWQMSSATQSGDEISLNFENITGQGFSAGKPYLIKPSKNVENPIFYNTKEIQNHTYNNVQSFDAADFVGSFYNDVIPAGENNLFLQDNNLYYSETNDTPIKGTRAWIRLKSSSPNHVRARIIMAGQVATAIDLVDAENNTLKTIENGQLVIIRDGIRYNVLGVTIK